MRHPCSLITKRTFRSSRALAYDPHFRQTHLSTFNCGLNLNQKQFISVLNQNQNTKSNGNLSLNLNTNLVRSETTNSSIRKRRFSSQTPTSDGPHAHYYNLLKNGEINQDNRQEEIVVHLEELHQRIRNYRPVEVPLPVASQTNDASDSDSGGGFFGGLFGSGNSSKKKPKKASTPASSEPVIHYTAEKGLYVWGGCGSGKSFLMDLFYDTQQHIQKKRRVHFHEWMIEVHERIHEKAKGTGIEGKSETVWSAEAVKAQREALKAGAGGSDKVTHISDAMIMKQLFSILFRKGAVVVSTSNRPPDDLYLNGLNRPLFLPFIPLLKERCQIIDIASEVDYRLQTVYSEDAFQVFYSPIDEKHKTFFDEKFDRWSRGKVESNIEMEVKGHKFSVQKRAKDCQIGRFSFADLCDRPLGAHDYITIGKTFHTVFIDNIPALTLQERDQVRRFITLIDALYEVRTRMVLLSENKASEIFSVDPSVDKKTAVQDEIFAWDRTVSRLTEMSNLDYLKDHARRLEIDQFWPQFDLSLFTDEEIDEIWSRFDVDDSGELDEKELRIMMDEIYSWNGFKEDGEKLNGEEFGVVWSAFDVDSSGLVDKEEFRGYVKKYTLAKIPPFMISERGSKPELKVFQEGAKLQRKKSMGKA